MDTAATQRAPKGSVPAAVDPVDAYIAEALQGKATLAQCMAILAIAEAHARKSARSYAEAV